MLPILDCPPWLYWLESCSSTNSWALANLSNLQHGDVVFTRQQTAGRGQQGRVWQSPAGVLTASFVLNKIPARLLPILSLAIGLAVIETIEDLLPDCKNLLRLKWTNDVFLQERKLAGILCEATTIGQLGKVVVGIGLNRCAVFEPARRDGIAPSQAISLHEVSSTLPDERCLLKQLRYHLLQTAVQIQDCPLDLAQIRSRDLLWGRFVTLELGDRQISGQAVGIDDRGCLQLRLADGEIRSFASGHVLWQNHSPSVDRYSTRKLE